MCSLYYQYFLMITTYVRCLHMGLPRCAYNTYLVNEENTFDWSLQSLQLANPRCKCYSIHTPPSDLTCWNWKTSHSHDCHFSYWRHHLQNWSKCFPVGGYQSLPLWCTSSRSLDVGSLVWCLNFAYLVNEEKHIQLVITVITISKSLLWMFDL